MEREQIEEKVRAFLVDELEIEDAGIVPDAKLKEDLGIDSLEIVDVAVFVDSEFGFRMKPEDFRGILTFGDFCSYIEGHAV